MKSTTSNNGGGGAHTAAQLSGVCFYQRVALIWVDEDNEDDTHSCARTRMILAHLGEDEDGTHKGEDNSLTRIMSSTLALAQYPSCSVGNDDDGVEIGCGSPCHCGCTGHIS